MITKLDPQGILETVSSMRSAFRRSGPWGFYRTGHAGVQPGPTNSLNQAPEPASRPLVGNADQLSEGNREDLKASERETKFDSRGVHRTGPGTAVSLDDLCFWIKFWPYKFLVSSQASWRFNCNRNKRDRWTDGRFHLLTGGNRDQDICRVPVT